MSAISILILIFCNVLYYLPLTRHTERVSVSIMFSPRVLQLHVKKFRHFPKKTRTTGSFYRIKTRMTIVFLWFIWRSIIASVRWKVQSLASIITGIKRLGCLAWFSQSALYFFNLRVQGNLTWISQIYWGIWCRHEKCKVWRRCVFAPRLTVLYYLLFFNCSPSPSTRNTSVYCEKSFISIWLFQPFLSSTQDSPCLSECMTTENRTPSKCRLKWVILYDGNIRTSPAQRSKSNLASWRTIPPSVQDPKGITTQIVVSPESRCPSVLTCRFRTKPGNG